MSSQYFPPYIVGRSNNVKIVLDLRGYLRKDDKTLIKKKDLDYFQGKSYFDSNDCTQNYLIFRVRKKYFQGIDYSSPIPLGTHNLWGSSGISGQTFSAPDQTVNVSINLTTRPFYVTL